MRLLSILFLLFGATGASHERISEIAIRDNESEDENSIWSANGVTHADLREEAASDLNLPEDYEENADRFEDGFLTSTGRFVDRVEAARIATEAGQAKQPLHEDREGPHLQHSDQLSDSLGSDRSIRRWSLKRHSTTADEPKSEASQHAGERLRVVMPCDHRPARDHRRIDPRAGAGTARAKAR